MKWQRYSRYDGHTKFASEAFQIDRIDKDGVVLCRGHHLSVTGAD